MRYETEIYIIHNSEDGIRIERLRRGDFDAWIKERTEDIKTERLPKFVDTLPNEASAENEYFIIEGRCLIPKPVKIVETYELPK